MSPAILSPRPCPPPACGCRTVLAALGAAAFLAACGSSELGSGLGRPAAPSAAEAPRLPLRLAQLDPHPGAPFVQLVNDGDVDVDPAATGLRLRSATGQLDVAAAWADAGPLAPGVRRSVDVAALGLHAAAGEVLLVDRNERPHAYLAWGNAPGTAASGLGLVALRGGLAAGATFVAVPFGWPAGRALGDERRAPEGDGPPPGCVTSDPQRPDAAAVGPCGGAAAAPAARLTELAPAWPDGSGSWIEVHNEAAQAIDLAGLLVCRGATGCRAIGRSVPLAAEPDNAYALLYFGQMDAAADAAHVLLPQQAPLAPAEEVALAAPGDAAALATGAAGAPPLWGYVRTDPRAPTVWLAAAQRAGLAPAAAPVAPRLPEDTLNAAPAAAAPQWTLAQASPGKPAPAPGPADDPDAWTACSTAPPADGAAPGLVVEAVIGGAAPALWLHNRGAAPLPLDGLALRAGDGTLPLPSLTLASDRRLVLPLVAADRCAEGAPCWPAAPGLGADDEVAVVGADGVPVAFVQWGRPQAPSRLGAAARRARVWPGPHCRARRAVGDDLYLAADRPGTAPPDYGPLR